MTKIRTLRHYGRGGSDTTAVALAAFLKAERCDIYTDVDGVYTADPNIHSDAIKYDVLSYDKMLEMANNGAKVLHSKCVEIAKKYNVPIIVKSSFDYQSQGTLIANNQFIKCGIQDKQIV